MTCEQCGRPVGSEPVRTATRTLCRECGADFLGAAAGLLAGGSVADAVATRGWFRALRDAARERRDRRR